MQEHFTLPCARQPPIPLSVPLEAGEICADRPHPVMKTQWAVDAEEKTFIQAMQRKKKMKKRKGLRM